MKSKELHNDGKTWLEVDIEDTRMPGGSKEEIERDYNLIVNMYGDNTFKVSGKPEDVRSYLENYAMEHLLNQ